MVRWPFRRCSVEWPFDWRRAVKSSLVSDVAVLGVPWSSIQGWSEAAELADVPLQHLDWLLMLPSGLASGSSP